MKSAIFLAADPAVAAAIIDLVEQYQIKLLRQYFGLAEFPDFPAGFDVLLGVLRVPGEAVAHRMPFNMLEFIGRLLLAGFPFSFDILDHTDPHAPPGGTKYHPECAG